MLPWNIFGGRLLLTHFTVLKYCVIIRSPKESFRYLVFVLKILSSNSVVLTVIAAEHIFLLPKYLQQDYYPRDKVYYHWSSKKYSITCLYISSHHSLPQVWRYSQQYSLSKSKISYIFLWPSVVILHFHACFYSLHSWLAHLQL